MSLFFGYFYDFLFIFGVQQFHHMCPGEFFCILILHVVHWVSWIYKLMSLIKFQKFEVTITSNIVSILFFFFIFFQDSNYTYFRPDNIHQQASENLLISLQLFFYPRSADWIISIDLFPKSSSCCSFIFNLLLSTYNEFFISVIALLGGLRSSARVQ